MIGHHVNSLMMSMYLTDLFLTNQGQVDVDSVVRTETSNYSPERFEYV